jgi:SAM-dependent methyltransferase
MTSWDADRYQRQFGFVSALGGDVLDLLDPSPGETVLDLGCGTGELAAARLWHDGRFVADYWRLRFLAVAADDAARPAKLHRQMAGNRGR